MENKYRSDIEKLREERSRLRTKVEKSTLRLERILRNFKEDAGDGLITYKDLKEIPFNQKMDLKNGVSFTRIEHKDKEVFFITEMKPEDSKKKRAEFGKQWHDCIEICKVVRGHLIESYQLDKEYKSGECVVYGILERHKPYATIDSAYEVEFLKPNSYE